MPSSRRVRRVIIRWASLVAVVALTGLVACSDAPTPVGNGDNDDSPPDPAEPVPVEDACEGDEKLCGDACVNPTDDPRHCGRCDESCPEGHLCEDGMCVAHDGDCPAQECTGLTYCEGESGLCLPGCRDDDQCAGGRICNDETHSCECPDGQRLCGGACFDDDDPDACGTDCLICPDAGGAGTADCVGGECHLECGDGQRGCDWHCADCPDGADETGCDGTRCVATGCGGDQRACGGDCVDCPDGATDTACDGDRCIADDCPDGQLPCGGDCVDCPGGADETGCDGDQCVALSCLDSNQRPCAGDCVDCPDGAAETDCEGAQCIATECVDERLLCDGTCAECAVPAGARTCDGSQCVTGPCDAGEFECPDYGCCVWDVDELAGQQAQRISPVSVDGSTPAVGYVVDDEDETETGYGVLSGGQWSLESTGQYNNYTFIPGLAAVGQDPYLFHYTVSGIDVLFEDDTGDWQDFEVADSGGAGGLGAGVDDTSTPFVIGWNHTVRIATMDGGPEDWSVDEITGDIGNHFFMEADVDTSGGIHFIAIEENIDDSGVLYYGTDESGSWQVEEIADGLDDDYFELGSRQNASLTLLDGDTPLIAYVKTPPTFDADDSLHVVERTGTGWDETEIVDETRLLDVSLRADDYHPHLLYWDDGELHHARRVDGDWHTGAVEAMDEGSWLDGDGPMSSLYFHDDMSGALAMVERQLYHLTLAPADD